MQEVSDFFGGSEDVREPSKCFGPISNVELFAVLMESCYYRQTTEARDELRRRLFDAKAPYIERVAQQAEEA